MIRINLLGVPRAKKGARAAAASMGAGVGEGPNIIIFIVIIAVIAAAGNWWYYNKLNAEQKKIAADIKTAEVRGRQLAEVKTKFTQRQREAENYKRRVDVIDQLRAAQSGPANLLNQIGDTVNTTDAVWLSTMHDDGGSISLEGTALSVDAMANLMTNLKKTGMFKSVELTESYQDTNVRDMQAFLFTLKCEKKS